MMSKVNFCIKEKAKKHVKLAYDCKTFGML